MKYKIKWEGENTVAFYEEGKRIELRKGDIIETDTLPKGAGFKVLNEEEIETLDLSKKNEELRAKLEEIGLSPIRTRKVLDKFSSIEELVDSLDKLPFDEVTNNFLIEKLGKPEKRESRKSKKVEKEPES
jgi:hypothetical protein